MHGHIHNCLHVMIMKNYGDSTWRKLMYKSGSDLSHFMKLRIYDDAMTMKLLETTAQVIGIEIDDFILEFGRNFLQYIMDIGYFKLLQSLGPTFHDFVENLDTIHSLLYIVYDDIKGPQFRCERFPDNTLLLHYYTSRPQLSWMIGGMMLAAAESIYKVKLAYCLEKIGTYTEEPSPISHTAMVIRVREDWATEHLPMEDLMRKFRSEVGVTNIDDIPENLTSLAMANGGTLGNVDIPDLTSRSLTTTFPYHIVLDEKMVIQQTGLKLKRLYPQVCVGTPLLDSCKIKYPKIPPNFKALRQFMKASFIIEIPGRRVQKALFLKGQMLRMGDKYVIFVCSPYVDTIVELLDKKIYICDLPVFDTTREFMLLNQLRVAETGKGNKSEDSVATLQRLTAELAAEKTRSDTLLRDRLPDRIVKELRESHRAPAEAFELTSILFTEIVNIDQHAKTMKPVDLVEILNNISSTFDSLVKNHDLFKVETNSDINMAVGGVPEPDLNHAKKVGLMALDMKAQAGAVIPSGKSQKDAPQIKIGIHSGPVVGGVVGDKLPRYCLFGNTVTTASQMMELCPPAKIQTSQEAQRYLSEAGFQLEERGTLKVKGRGKMTTYFLISVTAGTGNATTEMDILRDKPPQSSICVLL